MAMRAGDWDVPLPGAMDALIDGLLAEADMAPDTAFCSPAFQQELDAFLKEQVPCALLYPCPDYRTHHAAPYESDWNTVSAWQPGMHR